MSNVLDQICARKREHVAAQKQKISFEQINQEAAAAKKPRGFINALQNHAKPAIIAEVKKASPSVGVIREDFDAVEIAKIYEQSGAACLSVLTDEPYFQGKDEYLQQIKAAVALPLLRKDFILDEYQIYESRALGADCILLIMAALTDAEAKNFYKLSVSLGMDVLVEIHDEEELIRALDLKPAMIGINNRNLKTLEVDVQTSHLLGKKIPANIIRVAESGISKKKTIQALQADGFHAFLIGESLMKERDIKSALDKLYLL
jgi:indole-3-glycerol phosphate synthase